MNSSEAAFPAFPITNTTAPSLEFVERKADSLMQKHSISSRGGKGGSIALFPSPDKPEPRSAKRRDLKNREEEAWVSTVTLA